MSRAIHRLAGHVRTRHAGTQHVGTRHAGMQQEAPHDTERSHSMGRPVRAGLLAAALLGVVLLAACGKKGPPVPPGPPADITYPRSYPTR